MNFNSFIEDNNLLLLEANYSYSIPTDKELMMYDFYMMFHWLDTLDYSVGEPKADMMGNVAKLGSMRMGLREKTKESFDHIKEQVLNYLKEEMLEGSFYAIACEMRHLVDRPDNLNTLKDRSKFSEKDEQIINTFMKYFQKYYVIYGNEKIKHGELKRHKQKMDFKFGTFRKTKEGNTSDYSYQASYAAAKKTLVKENIERIDFCSLAIRCFDKNIMQWAGSYGGPPWKSIAEAHSSLHYATTQFKKILYIDNVYHQQHNTDTMFNKVSEYYKASGGYGWIKNALNFKADNKEPYELIRKIMSLNKGIKRGVDKMYIEMLKAAGKESYQEYFKIGPPDPKVKTEFPDETMKTTLKKEAETLKNKKGGLVPDLSGITFDATEPVDKVMQEKMKSFSKDILSENAKKFLESRNWGQLKKEGPSKYPSIATNYSYLGTGYQDDSGYGLKYYIRQLLEAAGYDMSDSNAIIKIHIVNNDGSLSPDGKAGTIEDKDYFMSTDKWNAIFGTIGKGASFAKNAKLNVFEQIKQYVKDGEDKLKPFYDAGYVFVGPGTNKDKPLCQVINDFLGFSPNDSQAYLYLIPDTEFTANQFNMDEYAAKANRQWKKFGKDAFYQFYTSGSEPTVGYFTKKDKWEELNGAYDKLPEEKKKAHVPKEKLNVDMEKVDNPGLKAIFAAVQEGPSLFPKTCDPEKGKFVYVGKYDPNITSSTSLRRVMADGIMEGESTNYNLSYPMDVKKIDENTATEEEKLTYYNAVDNKMAHGQKYSHYDSGNGNSPSLPYFLERQKWKDWFAIYEQFAKMLGEPQERQLSKLGLTSKENIAILKILKKQDSDTASKATLDEVKHWELNNPILSLVFKRGTVVDLDMLEKYVSNSSSYDYYRYIYPFNKLQTTGLDGAQHFLKNTIQDYRKGQDAKMVVHSIVPGQYGRVSIYSIIQNADKKGLVQFTMSTGDFIKNLLEILTAHAFSVTYKSDLIMKMQALTQNTLTMEQYANAFFSIYNLYALSVLGEGYNTTLESVKFRPSKEIQEENPKFKKYYSSSRAQERATKKDSNVSSSVNSLVVGYVGKSTDLGYTEKQHYVESLIPLGIFSKGKKKGHLYLRKLSNKPLDSYEWASKDSLGTNPAQEIGVVFSGVELKEIDINEDGPNKFFDSEAPDQGTFKKNIYTGFYDGGKGIVVMKDEPISKNGIDTLPGLRIMMVGKDGEFSLKFKSFEKEKDKIKFLDGIAVKMQGKHASHLNPLYGLIYNDKESVINRTWNIIHSFLAKKTNWEQLGQKGSTFYRLLPGELDKSYDKQYMKVLRVSMAYISKLEANENQKPYEYYPQNIDSFMNEVFNRQIIPLTDSAKVGKLDEIIKKTHGLNYADLVGRQDSYGNSKDYKKLHNSPKPEPVEGEHDPIMQSQEGLPRFKDFVKARKPKPPTGENDIKQVE